MAKKPETNFKERIRPKLDELPCSWWVKTQMLALLGVPDFIGCIRGQFVALELKKDSKAKASKLQEWCLLKIARAGGIAKVVSPENWEEIYAELQSIGKPAPAGKNQQ